MVRVFEQLEPFGKTYIAATMPKPDLDLMITEHDLILERIGAQDAEGAADAARSHQLHVAQVLIDQTLEEDAQLTRKVLQTRLGITNST